MWNTYIMAVDLEGSVVGPGTETAATAEGHNGNVVYWLLLFSLVGGLVSYGWSRGWRSFGSDIVSLPRRFGEAITRGPAAAVAMLLWGMSISLIISTLISSAVSAVLGLVLLTLAATPVGVVLNFALIRVWRGLVGVVAPNAGARLAGMLSPFMVMVGEALGLFVDWMVGAWLVGLVLGIRVRGGVHADRPRGTGASGGGATRRRRRGGGDAGRTGAHGLCRRRRLERMRVL